jgi:hypothetical protein
MGQCRRSEFVAPRFCTACSEHLICAKPPAPQQLAMGASSWVGPDAYLLFAVPPESQKVVQCRCFAWSRLPRLIPPPPPTIKYGCRCEQLGVPGAPVRCAAIASKSPSRAEPAVGVSQSRSIASTTSTRPALATTATGRTGPCAAVIQAWRVRRGKSGAANQPFPHQPGRQGIQLLQRQRLCRGPAHWRRRLSPAAARGSGRGHLGRCGNASARC